MRARLNVRKSRMVIESIYIALAQRSASKPEDTMPLSRAPDRRAPAQDSVCRAGRRLPEGQPPHGALSTPRLLAERCLCRQSASMPVQITIRDVPEDVCDELAVRAALQRQSMQEFLRGELERIASRPSLGAWLRGVRNRKEAAGRIGEITRRSALRWNTTVSWQSVFAPQVGRKPRPDLQRTTGRILPIVGIGMPGMGKLAPTPASRPVRRKASAADMGMPISLADALFTTTQQRLLAL